MRDQGVQAITWRAHLGACGECMVNDGKTVSLGSRFPSGAYLVPNHDHCVCEWVDDQGRRYEWTGVDGEYRQIANPKSTESASRPIFLFLDIDGVLNGVDLGADLEKVGDVWTRPIPNAVALLRAIDQERRLSPVWLSHWGERSVAWNDYASTRHWPVGYPTNDPDDGKPVAIQYYLARHGYHNEPIIWVQDGFSDAEWAWAKQASVQLVDTTKEPLRSLLINGKVHDILAYIAGEVVIA